MTALLTKLKSLPLIFFLIVAIAAFLRFYNLKDSLMFQGDQGRDALVVSQIFQELDPVFIGPVTSIGNMYLGPFYYYFMLPFLFLSYPSPMGPVYAVAGLGLVTVVLFFFIARRLFDQKTALIGTFFFGLSAGAVNLSRFSWNPNIAPFFSLLMFYWTYLAWKKNSKYWIYVAICFALLIQLHYVTLLAFSGPAIILLLQIKDYFQAAKNKTDQKIKQLGLHVLFASVIFLISLTPLVLFDFKHGFVNATSFTSILTEKESFDLERKTGGNTWQAIHKFLTLDLKDRASQIIFEPSFGVHPLNHPLLFVLLITVIIYLVKTKAKLSEAEIVLAAYLIPAIIGISVYQHQVYEHYIAYLFPMVYLLYGLFFSRLKPKFLSFILFIGFGTFFITNNLNRYWLKSHTFTIDNMLQTAQAIHNRVSQNEKYNIVLLSESKDLYGMNYRYFLNTLDNKPVKIEDHHQAQKLFIINEEHSSFDPVSSEIYEIKVFPSKTIVDRFTIENGPEIIVLQSYN